MNDPATPWLPVSDTLEALRADPRSNLRPEHRSVPPHLRHQETLNIGADSHFDHVLFAELNFPPCIVLVQHQSEGTAEVQDSTLLLHMNSETTRVDNNCG
jgi:hypothetical protein